ncbi:MAG TPA: FkbM family methyltransferase [Vicinamibacterales bacterium]|jgi:FkbM family methyltransferase|nr:FkbM family methyltransferase [Vicinamibacterales bacterium]
MGNSFSRLRRRLSDRRRRQRRFGLDVVDDVRTLFWHAPPQLILDIGANTGRVSLRWHRGFPDARIHAFEPVPGTFARLQTRVAARPQITPWNLAVGDAPGQLPMRIFAGDENNSLLPMAANASEFVGGGGIVQQQTVDVEVTTVDRFCGEHRIATVDVLKSDTQGYELQVLRGAAEQMARGAVGALVLEVHFVPHYEGQALFADIHAHLQARGFRFVGLYQPSRNHVYALNWGDALFVLPSYVAPRIYPPA